MAAFKIPFMSDFISGFSFDGFRRIKVEQGTSTGVFYANWSGI